MNKLLETRSVSSVAVDLDVARSTVTRQLSLGLPSLRASRATRAPRGTSAAVTLRRRQLRALARLKATLRSAPAPLTKKGLVRKNARQPRVRVVRVHDSIAKLRNALPTLVSRTTIFNDLRALNFTAKRRPVGPVRYFPDTDARMAFVPRGLALKINQILFSDEKFASCTDASRWEWVEPGEIATHRGRERFPLRLHIWGLIGIGVKRLVILPDMETMRHAMYETRCLAPNLDVLRRRGAILLQDGAACHVAAEKWLQDNGVAWILSWPARSPDLNMIELVWALLSTAVNARRPMDLDELRKCVAEEWARIPQAVIDKICFKFHSRLRAVKKARGATIR